MNYGLNKIDHNFINLSPFGMFNSDLERELYEESASVNNGKMILTLFLDIFTWPVINSFCILSTYKSYNSKDNHSLKRIK
jgi:hypothetical protein